MATELAILLRNGPHETINAAAGNIGYALKCSQVSVQVAKTPIQIPIPQSSPELVDIGSFRPSINIIGLIDNIGGDSTNVVANVQGMTAINHTRETGPNGSATAKTYYIPYKNRLEDVVYNWIASGNDNLELEIGDAEYAIGVTHAHGGGSTHTHQGTGGGVYYVAVQQCRFQLDAAKEDRWEFNMQFVAKSRDGVTFTY